MAQYATNKFLEMLGKGQIDLSNAATDLRSMLVNSTFVFNPDVSVLDDGGGACPKAKEISAAGYSRQALASETVTRDDANDMLVFTFSDLNFGSPVAGQTIGGLVIYKHNAADTSAEFLMFYDTVDIPTAGIPIVFQCPTAGSGGGVKLITG